MAYNGAGTFNLYNPGNPVVTGTTISSSWANSTLSDLATGLSTVICKDGQTTLTANIPMANFKLTGLGAGTAAGNSVRYEQSPAYLLTAKGSLISASAANTPSEFAVGSNTLAVVADSTQTSGLRWDTPVIRSYLAGCALSTAGSSATMSIAAGTAADSTNVRMMALAATSKTTSSWAVGSGNGGLDTGSIANTTWYHFYVIQRVDTGVVDCIFSTSASAPTLPTNYTLYRRIGSGLTNGSAQWVKFVQNGDLFQWDTRVQDVSAANPGTSAVTRTMTVPTGIIVQAWIQAILANSGSGGNSYGYFTNLAITDTAASTTIADIAQVAAASGSTAAAATNLYILTNTSAQVRSRLSFSDASVTLTMNSLGWIDRRGKDS